MRKLQYSLQTCALSLSHPVCHLRATKTIGSNLVSLSCCLLSRFLAPTNSFISDLQRKTWETLSHAHTHTHTIGYLHTKVHPTCTTPPDIVLPAHTCIEPGVFVLSNSGTSRCSCAQVSMCRHTCTVILSIHPKTCAEVRHTHTQSIPIKS